MYISILINNNNLLYYIIIINILVKLINAIHSFYCFELVYSLNRVSNLLFIYYIDILFFYNS